MTLPHAILREGRAQDSAFVLKSWLRALQSQPEVQWRTAQDYYREMTRLINRLGESVIVRVACDPDDPDHILGFAAWHAPSARSSGRAVVHCVYVKKAFRGFGVGTLLLTEIPEPIVITARVPAIDRHIGRHGWVLDPSMLAVLI